jgi:hypothetical protein
VKHTPGVTHMDLILGPGEEQERDKEFKRDSLMRGKYLAVYGLPSLVSSDISKIHGEYEYYSLHS